MTATAHRHRHSPRIRRRARDLGVDPDSVVGTGPGGRVTEPDLRRSTLAPVVPIAPPAGGIAALEVALAPALVTDRGTLLARAAAGGLAALRRRGVPATAAGLTRGDGTTVVPGAHDLTLDALQLRLAAAPTAGGCDIRVLDAGDVDAQVGLPAAGERAVVALGAVRERVTLERRDDGLVAFVARATVTVTVAAAPDLPEPVSAEVARDVARRLATA